MLHCTLIEGVLVDIVSLLCGGVFSGVFFLHTNISYINVEELHNTHTHILRRRSSPELEKKKTNHLKRSSTTILAQHPRNYIL